MKNLNVSKISWFVTGAILLSTSILSSHCLAGISIGEIYGPLSLDSAWPPQGEGGPCWSPDGTMIVFSWGDGYTAWDPSLGTPNPDGSYIVIMTADGQAIRGPDNPLVNDVGWDNHSPDWSPDGDWIVYAGSRVGPAYISRVSLIDGTVVPIQGTIGGHPKQPKWSPDGSKIAYLGGDWWGSPRPYHICVTDPDGSFHEDLTLTVYEQGVHGLSWSPDGTQIVFTQYGPSGLFVVDVATKAVTMLPSFPSDLAPTGPVWCSGGDSILFSADGGIYCYQINTKETEQLTYGPGDSLGDWHPTAGLVFSSTRGCTVRWDSNIHMAEFVSFPREIFEFYRESARANAKMCRFWETTYDHIWRNATFGGQLVSDAFLLATEAINVVSNMPGLGGGLIRSFNAIANFVEGPLRNALPPTDISVDDLLLTGDAHWIAYSFGKTAEQFEAEVQAWDDVLEHPMDYDPHSILPTVDMEQFSELVSSLQSFAGNAGSLLELQRFANETIAGVKHINEHVKKLRNALQGEYELVVEVRCPTDLQVISPDGYVVGSYRNDIPGAWYSRGPLEGGFPSNVVIGIAAPVAGPYTIVVTPFPGTKPTDIYSLETVRNGVQTMLADEVKVQEIPQDPYQVVAKVMGGIHVAPKTLNLESKGILVTCYIELPEGYEVSDIDISTVCLNGNFAEYSPTEIGDYDNDGIPDLMVKFDRQLLIEEIAPLQHRQNVELTLTGQLNDGTNFECMDTIKVIGPIKAGLQ